MSAYLQIDDSGKSYKTTLLYKVTDHSKWTVNMQSITNRNKDLIGKPTVYANTIALPLLHLSLVKTVKMHFLDKTEVDAQVYLHKIYYSNLADIACII